MRQIGEPSVEEILESIKRVIQRDNADAARKTRRLRESGVASDAQSPEDTISAFSLGANGWDESEDVLDLSETGAPLDEQLDEDLNGTSDSAAMDGDAGDDQANASAASGPASESLTNDRAADAMRQSLAALAMLSDPPAKPQIVRSGETSLEGLVRELLRPMLAEWLDTNLPDIVERQVKAEIARIAGKKR
ncbi:hypothetical protein CP97_02035 [Aurantiacibacter atlanticus]|uniref:Pole-organizing protein PopZ n=1 Tax=Aurantiacibacter atlanticus TaxID=1648404 RepID=A0A0H4V997_9SPHN|nr:DUF2497 domain-containing protein [Aurantiacibacter atlanticus]AKQ41085.1 hypothetical protein CP97_02035 [Aurantiacibacter atlanticus]MDF1833490.1 DUF2497 domain-containing protein [Alteraurantiacibacter sp. bin_em_oilr2.035]